VRACLYTTSNLLRSGFVGAHEQTVRHWIKTRELKASKFGTRIGYRIKRSDFEAFLDRRTLTGAIAVQLLQVSGISPESSPRRPNAAVPETGRG
jgi:excisionase family DNA binding protein